MSAVSGALRAAAVRWWRRAVSPRVSDADWRHRAALVVATLAVLLFTVRVLAAAWPGQFTIFFPDSFSFKNAARHTPFSLRFYASERPLGYPTLLFVLGRSTALTVLVQTVLYGCAYAFAVFSIWRVLRHAEACVVISVLVVTIAIEPRFALWNTHILSESLGMTLAVASVICWVRFAHEPSRSTLRWACLATVGWMLTRDSNVPPALVGTVPALLIASRWWAGATADLRRSLRNWAAVLVIVGLGAAAAQAANGRNRYPTMNNVGLRVLPDAELTAWFVDHGMPIDDTLRAHTGMSSFDNGMDMLQNPELAEFREWADTDGQRWMLISYIRFAPDWIDALVDDLPRLLADDHRGYDAFGVSARLPAPPSGQLNGPRSPAGLLVWTLVSVAGLVLAAASRRRLMAVALALALASSFTDVYLAYVGDSVEVSRHMVGPLARLSLVMVLCVGVGLDAAIALVPRRRTSRAADATSQGAADAGVPT